jgi:hypothetical protein
VWPRIRCSLKTVAAVDEVGAGECVAHGMRAAASRQAGPKLQPTEELLGATPAQWAATPRAKNRPARVATQLAQVADQRLAGSRADRHDPLAGPLPITFMLP